MVPYTRRVLRKFREILSRVRGSSVNGPIPVSIDLFSTHLPVLIGISRIAPFRRVLELGGGRFSTPLFLNTLIFPSVERVLTIENDLEWGREIEGLVGNRPTHELRVVNGAIASEIATLGMEEFDLVFVDDSRTISERVNTLRESARFVSAGAVVVVHDFEAPAYQLAATGFRNRLLVTGFYPATGILWNDAPLKECQLEMLCTIVRLSAAWNRPEDISAWSASFAGIPSH